VDDHEKDIEAFQGEVNKGKDEDIRAFASKTLPTLQAHHDSAEAVYSAITGKKK
jgi:putative membrane protein